MFFDTHCHLHDEKFDGDLAVVLQRANKEGVDRFVTIGCDIDTSQRAKEISHKHENIYFSAGFHPHDAKFLTNESFLTIKEIAQDKKCKAIGECGLDYYYEHSNKEEQKKALLWQIDLSKELALPLVIHLRDAFLDFKEVVEKYIDKDQKVLIHCFSGTEDEAKYFIDKGFTLSLSGILTFKNPHDLIKVATFTPLNQLVIETDCPYLSPVPFRGKRNEPSYMIKTFEKLVSVRQEGREEIKTCLYENSLKFFNIS